MASELSLQEAIRLNRRSFLGDQNPNWRGGNLRACLHCQAEFTDVHYEKKKFCNRKCWGAYRRKQAEVWITCKTCGNKFLHPHPKRTSRRQYCNVRCMGDDSERVKDIQIKRKGWTMSEEAKQKISLAASKRIYKYSRSKNGFHESPKAGRIYYRSSYELTAFQKLDADDRVVTYIVEPFSLTYVNAEGNTRRYKPDIMVCYGRGLTLLIEVKAKWELKKEIVQMKAKAAREWCKSAKARFIFWTEKELGIGEAAQGAVLAKE